ncbi:MAG: hypothetical protein K2P76_13645 [Lachnospiraceae bacterium]|nr:hypothetical protein [Lachnospiraceae bacterium]
MKESLLFQKIYRISNSNMVRAGQCFTYNEKAFQCLIGKNPQYIDVYEFDGLENEELVSALYLRFMNRLPDPSAIQVFRKYQNICGEDVELLKFCLIQYLSKSPEHKKLFKKVAKDKNNIKNRKKSCIKFLRIILTEKALMCRVLFHRYIFEPLWMRIPKSIRNFIRKICGRETKEW